MPVKALSFLCNNLTNKIKKLSLFRIREFDSEDCILGEEHVIALANRCPQLEELDLGGQENFISEVWSRSLSAECTFIQRSIYISLHISHVLGFQAHVP
jgi:hypothetical protein